MELRRLLFALLAILLAGCGPTCIRAGGWGMNLEVCWEGKQQANNNSETKEEAR
jgi:hypothetical protein